VNPAVDDFITGSSSWRDEMTTLRAILLASGLREELKWAKPCYCHERANVAIMQPMKEVLALMFFQGALLSDPDGVLVEQGPNSRSAKRLEFTSVADVERSATAISGLLEEAIEIQESGRVVEPAPQLVLAEELQARIADDPDFAAAFRALTPGRQREYHLHVSSAKQASTRVARVDKHAPRILAGKGLRDR
jgi:uncharacterized protein YdeI (YjbR/CyaY-like superfamily)